MPKKEDMKKTVNETVKDENVVAAKEAAAKATEAMDRAMIRARARAIIFFIGVSSIKNVRVYS